MTTLEVAWAPPAGSRMIEPGVWEHGRGVYVDPAVSDEWEAARQAQNKAYADARRAEEVRDRPRVIEELGAIRMELEMRLFMMTEFFDAAFARCEELRYQLELEQYVVRMLLAAGPRQGEA